MAYNTQETRGLNERELQLMQSRKEWTTALGKKTNLLFILSILSIIMTVVVLIITVNAMGSRRYSEVKSALNTLYVCAGISLVLSIIHGGTLLSMGKQMDDFSSAGVMYILAQIASLLKSVFSASGLGSLFNLVSLGLSIAFLLKFCAAMISCFDTIGSGMSASWESFKTVYLVGTIGALGSVFLVLVPGLAGLAVIGVYGFSVMMIIVGIWEIVLLRQSAVEFLEYTFNPAIETRPGASAFHNVKFNGSTTSPRPVPAARNATMSRTDAVKKAEEMRRRREAKAAGIDPSEFEQNDEAKLNAEKEKINTLKQYKELLDAGVLTQEEFDNKKKEILGG